MFCISVCDKPGDDSVKGVNIGIPSGIEDVKGFLHLVALGVHVDEAGGRGRGGVEEAVSEHVRVELPAPGEVLVLST